MRSLWVKKQFFIFLGSPCENATSIGRRCAVYKQCISALQRNDLNSKMASELVGLLMLEVGLIRDILICICQIKILICVPSKCNFRI